MRDTEIYDQILLCVIKGCLTNPSLRGYSSDAIAEYAVRQTGDLMARRNLHLKRLRSQKRLKNERL